jgi:hypothetical protein
MNINYLKNNNTQRSIQSLKENCPATSPKSLIERWYAKDNIFDEIFETQKVELSILDLD